MLGWSFTDVKAYGRWKNDASLLTYLDTVSVLQHDATPEVAPLREAMRSLDYRFAQDWCTLPPAAASTQAASSARGAEASDSPAIVVPFAIPRSRAEPANLKR